MFSSALSHPSISFLLPAYNNDCSALVAVICRQADRLSEATDGGFDYEVVVGDDCSTMQACVEANRKACERPHCRFFRHETNGRLAKNRNTLVRLATKEYVVLIDSDLGVGSEHFVERYATCRLPVEVICGGLLIMGDPQLMRSNLRYVYVKNAEEAHQAVHRSEHPYQDFNCANIFARRDILLKYPFDERIRRYGYEDVLLGRELQQASVPVGHIDNQAVFYDFETNESYVRKTELGLTTLYEFRDDLRGYSRIQLLVERMAACGLLPLAEGCFRLFRKSLYHNLVSNHPSLLVYNLYRMGYYANLMLNGEKSKLQKR